MLKWHRVEPGRSFKLAGVDPGATPGAKGGKRQAEKTLAELSVRLEQLQGMLWAEHRHKILIVLQGMDTSGKDGTISHVFEGVNPLGVRVAQFKEPVGEEVQHDFLWRVHAKVPGWGEMVIFNRSHYEDVLVVRVRELVPPRVWKQRYRQINDFERLLTETETTILKFFLHIDADEQKKRLERRIQDPAKRWKFQPTDLVDRQHWASYVQAYEDALRKTSTEQAPWYVVPANKKWYRNLVVATVLVETLEGLRMKWPKAKMDLSAVRIE